METKGPIRHLGRSPDDLRVLPRNLGRVGLATGQKIKVKHATDDVILKRSTGVVTTNLDIHTRRTKQEDGVRATTIGTMFKVHRVAAIQICTLGDAISIAPPHRARRVNHVQAEGLRVFAETIDVGPTGKRGLDAEELRLEDYGVALGREEHLARARPRDVKRERRGGIRESYLRCVRARRWVRRGARQDGLGDFVARAGRVGYLEVYACHLVRGRDAECMR